MHGVRMPNGKTVLVGDCKVAFRPSPMPSRPAWLDRWTPGLEVVEFFRNMFGSLRKVSYRFDWDFLDWVYDPVMWRVPASGNLYWVDSENKKLVLLEGVVDEWHWKNIKTVAKLGWTVELAPKNADTGAGRSSAVSIDPTKKPKS